MKEYNNFKLAAYFTAPDILSMSDEQIRQAIEWYEKYVPLSKVYVETYRNGKLVDENKMKRVLDLFHKARIDTAGGITYTLNREDYNWPRIMQSFCYSHEKTREKVAQIASYTAQFFNEVILDDFYFTDCSCAECLKGKGEKTWKDFRLELMTEVSQNLIINPMKEVNPHVKVIIKYPNWNESFAHVGYNTEAQIALFDGIYTGTETRDPLYTQQHLPRYASYSLMRWMDDVSHGQNGGGWFDWIDCIYNIGSFLEQARLTALAKPRELTMFNFSALNQSLFIPPLGVDLERIDKGIGLVGKPAGVPFYHPHHGQGDQHIYDYLGMAGIPLAPTPVFPDDPLVTPMLFCGGSAGDDRSIEQMKDYVFKGGVLVISAGLAEKTQGLKGTLSHIYGSHKILAEGWSSHARGCAYGRNGKLYDPLLVSKMEIHTNDSFPLAVLRKGDYNTPFITLDHYGKGDILTLNLPDNPAEISLLPEELLNALRDIIFQEGLRLHGPGDVSLFLYDNNTLVLESFRRDNTVISLKGIKDVVSLNGAPAPDGEGIIHLPPGTCAFYKYSL